MQRFRICICYIITTILISVFVYCLIYSNMQNMKKLQRLKEEVDEMTHLLLQAPFNGKDEPKHMMDLIDNIVQKRLAGIWDHMYSLKKQLKARDCANSVAAATKNSKNEGAVSIKEERINYAAEELGAKITDVKADPISTNNIFQSWLGMAFKKNPPINMLKSNMDAGNCFGFKNGKAEVTIKLAYQIFVDQILLQHITEKQSPTEDTSSAPKDFQVFGILDDKKIAFGKYKFHNSLQKPLQNFNIQTKERYQYLSFHFDTNHGHPNYTCIYRIAVYGKL